MQFSENINKKFFFSQPHQPFFVMAFINAVITMIIFFLSYESLLYIEISPSNFHAYAFTYLFFTPAFLAFLFTTFPRFSSTPSIPQKAYMSVFYFYYLGATLYLLGSIVSPLLSAWGMILIFIGHSMGFIILRNIYTLCTLEDKHDMYWILLAMGFGVFANILFLIGQLWYQPIVGLSTEISTYLFLFLLTFSVAQRMVPFFSHCMVEKDNTLLKKIFVLLVLHIVIEGFITNGSFILDLIIGALLSKELYRWKLPFPNPNPLLWILHIALYWSALAFILSGLVNFLSLATNINFLALDIHAIVIGFVFTILIGFGTRVTLGHSGNKMHADLFTKILFYWTQVVVITRILVSLTSALGWNFMPLFDISAIAWIIMLLAWASRFFIVLIKGKKLD